MILNPIFTLCITVALLAAMTVAFVWMEYRRPLRYQFMRVVSVIMMMISIAGLLLRPSYRSAQNGNTALLTEGYSSNTVDSLIRKDPSLQLLSAAGINRYKNSRALASYQQLSDPDVKIKTVIGDGVPAYALPAVKTSFEYLPSKRSGGVIALYVPKEIKRNNTYHIEGDFLNTKDSIKLYLENAGDKIDSVHLKKGRNRFDLKFTPRTDGKLLYHIVSSDDKVERPVPIHVDHDQLLNILFLQTYPTFEIQNLKNFLSDRGHKLALRYQLSKGIFRYEYANRKSISISRINQQTLEGFDLVISDLETIKSLSATERSALNSSIADGLGFISLLSSAPRELDNDFLPIEFHKIAHDTTSVKIGSSTYALPASTVRPILKDNLSAGLANRSGILNGFTYKGKGKIGFQLLQETYRLLLSGDSINYAKIWSPLIDDVSKSVRKKSQIKVEGDLPVYSDEPFDVTVISSEAKPILFADSVRVPIIEDEAIDDIWHARLWAGKPGWHQLSTREDTTQYYIFQVGDWQDLRSASTIKSNLRASRAGNDNTPTETSIPYPTVYFYLMFVLSAGCLWLAPKL